MLLDRVENSTTGEILIPEFHTEISEKRREQAKQAAEALGDVVWSEFPYIEGGGPISKDKTQLLLNKTWVPQLAVTGASGFPPARYNRLSLFLENIIFFVFLRKRRFFVIFVVF